MSQALSPLVAEIWSASLKSTFDVSNRVVENLEHCLLEREAELAAIKADVERLLAGPWMPMPEAIHRAVHPTSRRIALEMERIKETRQ